MEQLDKQPADIATGPGTRKPRLALMGEFSAGKSTLTNMLLDTNPLPTRVTATRLPPVWISYGEPAAWRIDNQGNRHDLDLADLDSVELDETRLIRLSMKCDTLELCDLIDLPGISDPNMSSEIWQSVMDDVDSVVWCTHATQAWRQSEAATWEMISGKTNGDNLLLVTQFDKLQSERDRTRVLRRIECETEGLFKGIYPISLLEAVQAGEDCDRWASSGAAAFTEHLVDMLLNPTASDTSAQDAPQPARARPVTPRDVAPAKVAPVAPQVAAIATPKDEPRVLPKRVRMTPGTRLRTRPLTREEIEMQTKKMVRSAMESAG